MNITFTLHLHYICITFTLHAITITITFYITITINITHRCINKKYTLWQFNIAIENGDL